MFHITAYKLDLKNFKALFVAGERCDSATLKWAQRAVKVPVIDHWWQTETGKDRIFLANHKDGR